MSKVIEREHGVEPDRPTTVEHHELPPLETIERPAEFTPTPTAPEPSMFIRWMGWLLGALALVGMGGVVWWAAFSSNPADVTDLEAWHRTEVTPNAVSNHTNLESWHGQEAARAFAPVAVPAEIDPHVSPEILRASPVTGVSAWSLESLELLRSLPVMIPVEIDPHVSPEILRVSPVTGVSAWSLESLELLRSLPTQGIDELSLESLELLRGLPVMIPVEIDPHVSPEILRVSPVTGVSVWSLESLELLRSLPTQGIDELSLESLELLRGLPVMIPVEIDPHVSPEIRRINR